MKRVFATAILAMSTIALGSDYEVLNTDPPEPEAEECYKEIEPRSIDDIQREKAIKLYLEEKRKVLGKEPEAAMKPFEKQMAAEMIDFAIGEFKIHGRKALEGNFYIVPRDGSETKVIKKEQVFREFYADIEPNETAKVRQIVDKCEGETENQIKPSESTEIGTIGIKKDGKVETKTIKTKPKSK